MNLKIYTQEIFIMLTDLSKLEEKKILVTGGAGFIGSSLCKFLTNNGAQVTSVDNYFTGSENNHLPEVNYIKSHTKEINNINLENNYDFLFHFGEYSRVEKSFEDIDTVFDFNLHSIYEVLKFAKKCRAKFVYSGSSTKFGDDGKNAFASPYAWTKNTNSNLVKTFCEWNDMKHSIVYFYNVYGDAEISEGKYSTLIAKYISLKKNGAKELPVVLPGTQTRNFTHIDDIVEGIIIATLHGEGDGYGIGSDEEFSINEVVELFKLDKKYIPQRMGNRLHAPVLNDKLKTLGWLPKRNLKDYIDSTFCDE